MTKGTSTPKNGDSTPDRSSGGSPADDARPRIVVVGGGFGGIHAVQRLGNVDADILLIDRKNHHVFQPLLYQVATAALSPGDIAAPIRSVFTSQKNVHVVLGEVTEVDLDARVVTVGDARVRYDWLVLAAGMTHSYFGNDDWQEHAPGLKTVDEALEIRRRMLLAYERAEFEEDPEARSALLTFVVVGGGPTGVEMAGALREIATRTIPRDFRRVDTTTARVILLEGADRLLLGMSEEASQDALEQLQAMGVEVRLNTFVTEVEEEAVVAGKVRIPAANVIWAAGVRGVPLVESMSVERDRQHRVKVDPDCSIPGHPEVFVVGDLAHQLHPDSGEEVPGVAQGAIQMGAFVGKLMAREISGGTVPGTAPRPQFRYWDKGSMATIGRARAVADVGGRTFGGFFAWLLWSLIHVTFLIGFRNKLLVLVNWAWQWLVHTRGARLITGPVGSGAGGGEARKTVAPGTVRGPGVDDPEASNPERNAPAPT